MGNVECWAVAIPGSCAFYPDERAARAEADALAADSPRVVHLIDVARLAKVEHQLLCEHEDRLTELGRVNVILAEVERERDEARELVKDAYDYGGGHWGDWGERALCVAEMLSDAIDSWRNGGGK